MHENSNNNRTIKIFKLIQLKSNDNHVSKQPSGCIKQRVPIQLLKSIAVKTNSATCRTDIAPLVQLKAENQCVIAS
jgi:hypothetical protein